MHKIKQWFWNIFSCGLPVDEDLETLRKVILLNLMFITGGFFLTLLCTVAFLQRAYFLSAVDLTVLFFLFGLFFNLKKTINHKLVGTIGAVATGLFYFWLIAYGGVSQTAYIWSFTYPLIAVYLLGKRLGSIFSILLLAMAVIVFALGSRINFFTLYRIDLVLRFVPAYIIIYLFALVMEKVRETIQFRLKASKLNLENAFQEVQHQTQELAKSNQELHAEISERKRIERALRDSENFLDNVIESIQDGISVLNPDLSIGHTNSVMTKWYPDQMPLVGKKCYECYQDQSRPCDPCPTLRCLQTGKAEREIVPGPGSSVHLSKTVMNLVSNAAEAMPDGGKIKIATENRYIDQPIAGYDDVKEGDYVVLTVTDCVIGIPKDEIGRIFEPFYTKKVMGRSGTGFGMAVVWGTVKDHNGYIHIESKEGLGTAFKLYFPVTRIPKNGEENPTSINDYKGNGETILVVDDVEEQRTIASKFLKHLGYTVETASSGEEAVEYMDSNGADLVVLDMIMPPGIDGFETYKQLIARHPDQKAIIASGFSETDRVKKAQHLGAGRYVKKPYTMEKIGLAVKAELGNRQPAA
jgi:signal transduction histidine kinase/CheY-like chemotaxis protein